MSINSERDTAPAISLAPLSAPDAASQSSPAAPDCPTINDPHNGRPDILPAAERSRQRVLDRVVKSELVAGTDPRAIAVGTGKHPNQIGATGKRVGVIIERQVETHLREAITVAAKAHKALMRKDLNRYDANTLSLIESRHTHTALRIIEGKQGLRPPGWAPSPRAALALRIISADGHVEAQAIARQEDIES